VLDAVSVLLHGFSLYPMILLPAKMGLTVGGASEAASRRAAGYVLFGMSPLVLV
jgi:hypothetical protein